MRPVRLGLPLVLLLVLAGPAQGSATYEYDYVTAPTLSLPGVVRLNVALCDDPDDTCVGGARFPTNDPNALAFVQDDLFGSAAPIQLCVFRDSGSDACRPGDAFTQPGCGVHLLGAIPFIPSGGVAYVYAAHVGADLDVCFAATGRLFVETW